MRNWNITQSLGGTDIRNFGKQENKRENNKVLKSLPLFLTLIERSDKDNSRRIFYIFPL